MGNRLRVYKLANELFGHCINDKKPGEKVEINYEQSGAYRGLPSFTSGLVTGLSKNEIVLKKNGHDPKHIPLESIIVLAVYLNGERYPTTVYYKGKIKKIKKREKFNLME